jgi:hypothetical protein
LWAGWDKAGEVVEEKCGGDEGKVEIERKLWRRREGNEYGNRRGFR